MTSIEVAEVSCAQAEKVVMAYHQCRLAERWCRWHLQAPPWRASPARREPRQSVPGVQFNATADCRKGDAEIKSSYTQNF